MSHIFDALRKTEAENAGIDVAAIAQARLHCSSEPNAEQFRNGRQQFFRSNQRGQRRGFRRAIRLDGIAAIE